MVRAASAVGVLMVRVAAGKAVVTVRAAKAGALKSRPLRCKA